MASVVVVTHPWGGIEDYCPGGCGELADRCQCSGPDDLGTFDTAPRDEDLAEVAECVIHNLPHA